jgi:hypothetical protein
MDWSNAPWQRSRIPYARAFWFPGDSTPSEPPLRTRTNAERGKLRQIKLHSIFSLAHTLTLKVVTHRLCSSNACNHDWNKPFIVSWHEKGWREEFVSARDELLRLVEFPLRVTVF